METDLGDALTPCPGCGQDVPVAAAVCPRCGAAADTDKSFLAVRSPGGGSGMVDRMTAAFLRSRFPDPQQSDLIKSWVARLP